MTRRSGLSGDPVGMSTSGPALSRRAQAFLQRGAAAASPGGGALTTVLSMQDVAQLKNDRSAQSRALIARKFGASYDQLATGGHADLCQAILELLVKDVEKQVRQTLAEMVAHSPNLPVAIATRLARDDIDVARPILQESPVLDDAMLIEIVRTNAMQYALAVAARENLSEAITEALVDTGQQEVVLQVIGNATAKLSATTLRRVAEDWRGDKAIQDRLVRRPQLPYELVEHLVGVIGDRLEWELVQNRQLSAEQARALVAATRQQAAVTMTMAEHGDQRRERVLRERVQSGQHDHEATLKDLRDGDIEGFELGMALHAKLDVKTVRRLLYHDDRRHLCALAIRAGFPTPHYLAVRMALDVAARSVVQPGETVGYSSDTLQFLTLQYEGMRADPARVGALIDDQPAAVPPPRRAAVDVLDLEPLP